MDTRRLLRFRGLMREIVRGNLSPNGGEGIARWSRISLMIVARGRFTFSGSCSSAATKLRLPIPSSSRVAGCDCHLRRPTRKRECVSCRRCKQRFSSSAKSFDAHPQEHKVIAHELDAKAVLVSLAHSLTSATKITV